MTRRIPRDITQILPEVEARLIGKRRFRHLKARLKSARVCHARRTAREDLAVMALDLETAQMTGAERQLSASGKRAVRYWLGQDGAFRPGHDLGEEEAERLGFLVRRIWRYEVTPLALELDLQ
ncbi:hypothetical protein [Nannocystis pusilla]|uniref:hypothetical protein n=1 Tax=Nannocystis pusilla TaxID=889268 RepID=UPI003B77F331